MWLCYTHSLRTRRETVICIIIFNRFCFCGTCEWDLAIFSQTVPVNPGLLGAAINLGQICENTAVSKSSRCCAGLQFPSRLGEERRRKKDCFKYPEPCDERGREKDTNHRQSNHTCLFWRVSDLLMQGVQSLIKRDLALSDAGMFLLFNVYTVCHLTGFKVVGGFEVLHLLEKAKTCAIL